MRAVLLPVLAIVIVFLGTIAYFTLGGPAGSTALGGAVDTDGASPTASGSQVASDDALVAPAGEHSTQASAPARNAVVAEREVSAAPTAAGPEAWTGRVVDELGRPVSDAAVEVHSRAMRQSLFFHEGSAAAALERASSDGEGLFRLTVEGGEDGLEISVGARGYAPFREPVERSHTGELALGDLVLDRGVVLAGRVVDTAGRGVGAAELVRPTEQSGGLRIIGPRVTGDIVAVTDDDGRFEIGSQSVGDWKFVVRHDDHPDQRVNGTTEAPGDERTDLVVTLEDGFTIRGRVVDAPASELGSLEVRAWGGPEQQMSFSPGPQGSTLASAVEARSADVASDGTFAVRGLRKDKDYRLNARSAGHGLESPVRSKTAQARAGDEGVELAWSVGATLGFEVIDARDGDPIEDFTVEAGIGWRPPLRAEGGGPRTHFARGRVEIDGLWPTEGNDQASFRIDAPGFEPFLQEAITIEPEEQRELGVVRLTPMPTVRVTVLEAETGEPIEGAHVVLAARAPRGGARRFSARLGADAPVHDAPPMPMPMGGETRTGTTTEAGICVLSSFPGRTARLTVRSDGRAPFAERDIELPARDDIEREVQLSLGGAIVVSVRDGNGDPAPRAVVEHDRPVPSGEHRPAGSGGRRVDAQGRMRFAHLEPGIHAFRVQDENPKTGGLSLVMSVDDGSGGGRTGTGWEEVAVEGGDELSLTLLAPARASLYGIVTEDGKPLANADVVLNETGAGQAQQLARMFGGETSARTDSAGRYSFDDVKLGKYDVEVRHPSRAMGHLESIDLREGDNKESFELPVCVIEGKVEDESGKAFAGAAVAVKRRKPPAAQGGAQIIMMTSTAGAGEGTTITSGFDQTPVVRTDEHGHYSLRGVAAGEEVVVEVKAEGYEPTTSEPLTLQTGEVRREVDIDLGRGGTLIVNAPGDEDRSTEGWIVTAIFRGQSDVRIDPMATNIQNGTARFEDLAAGPWEVNLRKPDARIEEGSEGPESQTAMMESGKETTLTFALP